MTAISLAAMVGSGAGSGHLVPTSVKTANYSASHGELVRLNSAGGAFTVTLPSSPVDKNHIGFFDVTNSCGASAVLIAAAGGKTVEGDGIGLSINVNGAYVVLMYNSSTTNWKLELSPVAVAPANPVAKSIAYAMIFGG